MTRPLRITYPGAMYHIINRGSRRDKIFRRIRDRKEFLERLQAVCEKFQVIVHAYCLMDNHYHLILETPLGNISKVMQNFQGSYANWFRAKYNLIGPLFQSRYKSVLIEDESYLVTLSAYIHLNPVRAKMIDRAAEYRWSSCKLYLSDEHDELVTKEIVLDLAGGIENYAHILSSMVDNPPMAESIYGKFSIIGSETFKEEVINRKTKEMKKKGKAVDVSAIPEYRKLKSLNPEKIAQIVMDILNVEESDLTERKKGNVARKLYLFLLKKQTTMMIKEIAELVDMKPHSAGQLIRNFEKEVKRSKELRALVVKVEKKVG